MVVKENLGNLGGAPRYLTIAGKVAGISDRGQGKNTDKMDSVDKVLGGQT